jgi:hypothetical protein
LPYVETIDMPWGAKLIPVDELERLLAERLRAARTPAEPARAGRPPAVPAEVVERIRVARAAGESLRQIAAELNADGTPTAHGGARWWPLNRTRRPPACGLIAGHSPSSALHWSDDGAHT